MSTTLHDCAAILIQRQVVTAEQMEEARAFSGKTGCKIEEALVRLGYATEQDVMLALAEQHGIEFVDLTDVTIPPGVIELVPESVARENLVLPLHQEGGTIMILTCDPGDIALGHKLQFILDKEIQFVLATRSQLVDAINRHYAQGDQESVEELIQDFTATQIDFCEERMDIVHELGSEETCIDFLQQLTVAAKSKPAEQPSALCYADSLMDDSLLAAGNEAAPLVDRHATIRYYHRMNPERLFPLLVVISRKMILEVVKKGVSQEVSKAFQVAADSVVEIEPILPGCHCFPPREQVVIRDAEVTAKFHVVPHVLGEIEHARVVLRQNGRVLAEVAIPVKVVKQGLTIVCGAMSFLLSFGSMMLKHFDINFQSQAGWFAQLAQGLLWLAPEVLGGLLLMATVLMYFWLRPRQRDVFWDIETLPESTRSGGWDRVGKGKRDDSRADTHADKQATVLGMAERHFAENDFAKALRLYQQGLAMGKARPMIYHHASLAAGQVGDNRLALAILQQAETLLPAREIAGAMWFNMACFATRIGRLADAMRYLNRAVDAGYNRAEKYRTDPDLEPLRWRRDFKQMVRALS